MDILSSHKDVWICGLVKLFGRKITTLDWHQKSVYKKNAFFLIFFAKKFGEGREFDVSLQRHLKKTWAAYTHVRSANVVRMRMTWLSKENVKMLNC